MIRVRNKTNEEITKVKIAEAKSYLEATDFKMTTDYDEDTTEFKLKRKEAREYIRANEIKEQQITQVGKRNSN